MWAGTAGSAAHDSRLLAALRRIVCVFHPLVRAPVVSDTAAVTNYGGAVFLRCGVRKLMGVQFHPEKSADVGLRVFRNFVELC